MNAAIVVAVLLASAVFAWPGRRPSPPLGLPSVEPEQPSPVPVVQVASSLELVALALRSGCGLLEALDLVGGHLDDITGRHLRMVAAALRWGLCEEAAWAAVPPAWTPAAQALTLAAGAGVAPAELLLAAAEDVRRDEARRLETAAARLAVRVVLPLGLLFLPAFVLTTIVPVVIALSGSLLAG